MNWDQIVKTVTPYVVKIETPEGHGTGFLCLYNEAKTWCGIATAAHVVAHADEWQQPIRIRHAQNNTVAFLREGERVIFNDPENDSSVVLFDKAELQLPETLIPLAPLESPINIGCEVGWLGFPAIEPYTLCFFSGNVSARQDARRAYVLDGVAINGVSGGPVFFANGEGGVHIIGTMTAYRANRQRGDSLPGLAYAQDVSHFHQVVQHVQNIDDAEKKKKELEQVATKDADAQPSNAGEGTAGASPQSTPDAPAPVGANP